MAQVNLRVYDPKGLNGYQTLGATQQSVGDTHTPTISPLGGTTYIMLSTLIGTYMNYESVLSDDLDQASAIYTAPTNGFYRLKFQQRLLAEDLDSGGTHFTRVYKNGSALFVDAIQVQQIDAITEGYNTITYLVDVELAAGDLVTFLTTATLSSNTTPTITLDRGRFDIQQLQQSKVFDLDIDQSQTSIKADISSVEVDKIGDVFSVGTQTFTLPPTKYNNRFFDYAYEIGNEVKTQTFMTPYNCQLLVDGAVVMDGYLHLNEVLRGNNNKPHQYICSVVDAIPTLSTLTKNLTLGDLDWSAYDHAYSLTNITSSWDGDLFDGDIIYPNIHYGYGEGQPRDVYSYGDDTIFNQATLGGDNILQITDFKPAVRNRVVFDTIFEAIGLNYSSSFINGAEDMLGDDVNATFEDLYLLATPNSQKGVYDPTPTLVQGGTSTTQTITMDEEINLDPTSATELSKYVSGSDLVVSEVQDTTNEWDLPSGKFTPTKSTTYRVDLHIETSNPSWTIGGAMAGIHVSSSLGIDIAFGVPSAYNMILMSGQTNSTTTLTKTIPMTAGEEYEIMAGFARNDGGSFDLDLVKVQITPTNEYADTTLMDLQLTDVKILDYLRGIQQQFNLVFWTDITDHKTINIEPYNTYINSGVVRDWSSKVNHAEQWKITHPATENKRDYVFSNKNDDKDLAVNYTQGIKGKTLGSKVYQSDSKYAGEGEQKIGDKLFSPTSVKPLEGWADASITEPMTIPHIMGEDKKPIKFKPRLLFNNGKKTLPLGNNNDDYNRDYSIHDINTDQTIEFITYLQTSPLTKLDAGSDKFDVNFDGYDYWYAFSSLYGESALNYSHFTPNNSFNIFWADYINLINRSTARKVVMDVKFNPTDFLRFNLNDTIFIDGQEYLINKIKGFNFLNPQTTEVELIKKLNPFGVNFPIYSVIDSDDERERGLLGNTDRTIEFFFSESTDGIATPIDVEDMSTEVSSSLVRTFQYKQDGYQKTSNGEFIIDRYANQSNAQDSSLRDLYGDNLSNNNIRSNSKTNQVKGSTNFVSRQTTKTNIFGDRNNIGGATKDVFIAGDDNQIDDTLTKGILITSASHISPNNQAVSIIGGEKHNVSGSSNDGITIISTATQRVEGETNNDIVVVGGKNDLRLGGEDSVSFINTNLSSSLYGYGNTSHHGGTQKHIYSTIINDSLAGGDVPSSALDGFPSSYNTSSFGVYPAGRSTTFLNNRNMSNEYGLNGDNGEFINSVFLNNNSLNIERFNNSVSALLTHHQMFINTSNARFRFDDTLNTHYNNIFQGRTLSNDRYMFDTYINPQSFVAPYMVDNWMSNSSIISASNTIGNHVLGSNVDMGGVNGSGPNTLRENFFVNSNITRPNQQDTIISENIYEIADNTIIQTDITAFQGGRENILIGNQNLTSSYIDGDVLSGFEGGTTLNNVACLNNSDVDFYQGGAWGTTLIGNQNLNVGEGGFNTTYINNMGAGSTMLDVSASINSTYINNTLDFNQELYDNSPTSQSVVLGKTFHAGSVINGYQQIDFDGGASGLSINVEANVVLFNHGNTSTLATTITLPSAVDNDGMRIVLKDNGNASATYSYRVASTDGIDSSTFITFNTAYQTETIMAMGGQWFVI